MPQGNVGYGVCMRKLTARVAAYASNGSMRHPR